MRNFFMSNLFYRKVQKLILITYGIGMFCLSYRLIYNEYYPRIHKEVEVSNQEGNMVYPLGEIVGLYTLGDGIFVIDTCEIESIDDVFINPCKGVLYPGDYIIEVNGIILQEKENLIKAVNESNGESIELTVIRGEERYIKSVTPILGKNGKYMLGVWVKDDLAGVGTITYYTENGKFGALGHGMGDGVTNEMFLIKGGDAYRANVAGIKKGKKGEPGEVKGVIYYGVFNHIGELDQNCEDGIYGVLDKEDTETYTKGCNIVPLGNKQEIEIGEAQIISNVSGERKVYTIEISYVDYLAVTSNKGLHIEVTDPELLELTGGIVQGMSGSPIIQNGKLIGAVTHVLINDPSKGYGIFIEEMMK